MAEQEYPVAMEVDAKNLLCPLPILRAKKALATMKSGQILRVIATDPASLKDFAAFSRQTGNQLILSEEMQPGVYEFLMKRR